jgi:hypothetical protein
VQALRKLLQLSPREFWVLAQAAALLPAVHLALKFVTVARLQSLGARTALGSVSAELSQPTARMVRIAAGHGIYPAKCLEQSLVLRWLLQRQGIDARIFFGARKEDEQMEAHAWVEVNGVALNEEDDVHERFSPFEELAASKIN